MDGLTWLRCQWDRAAGWALVTTSVVLVAVAGGAARGAVYPADGLSYLMSGGIGALATGGLGCALLVSAGFHDEWRKLDRLEAVLRPAPAPIRAAGLGARLRAQWDRVLGWALVASAAVWLALGYHNVAVSIYPPEQVAYVISGGLVSLILIGAGATLLLAADWRDDADKVDRIAAAAGTADPDPADPILGGGSATVPVLAVGAVVLLLGAGAVGVGWAKAADAVRLRPAMDGLAVASAGLGVTLMAVGWAALCLRRSLVDRMTSVLATLAPYTGVDLAAGETGPVEVTGHWTADGLRRFHRGGCPALISARGERRVVKAGEPDLEPCLICET